MEGYLFDHRIINDSDSDHILKLRFGLNIDNDNNPLQHLIDSARKIPYIAAQIVLRESYEMMYGFDRGNPSPLSLVAKHPGEDVHTHSRLYNTINRFIENDVGSALNCSFMEFISMPREFTKHTMDRIAERRNRKNHSAAEIEKRLADELNGRTKR